jgi:hypothetical protein
MPTYDFKNKETGEVTERIMKMSELDSFKKANPHLEIQLSTPALCNSVRMAGGLTKGGAFKEVLQKIHSRTSGSILNKTTDI